MPWPPKEERPAVAEWAMGRAVWPPPPLAEAAPSPPPGGTKGAAERRRAGDGALVRPPGPGGQGLPASLRPDPAPCAQPLSSLAAPSPRGEPRAPRRAHRRPAADGRSRASPGRHRPEKPAMLPAARRDR